MVTSHQVRIIGGRFRGRRLPILDRSGLRPTPDRVRETLFNWLAPVIAGARCLDAFAGSGALGFEAVSRGCGEVVLLERCSSVVAQLRANARTLGASGVEIRQTDTLRWLAGSATPFDVVFLDPPFAEGLLGPTVEAIAGGRWLAPTAHIYLETSSGSDLPAMPEGWELIRDKKAGQVRYALAVRRQADAVP